MLVIVFCREDRHRALNVLDGENVRWKVSMYVMDLGHVRDRFLNVRDRELGRT